MLKQTGSSWTVNTCFLLYNLRNEQKEREVARGETNAFVPRASKVGRGFAPFLCLKRIQEYDLAEVKKVVIPTHLDDLVNVVCPLRS